MMSDSVDRMDGMPGQREGLDPELLRRLDNVHRRMQEAGFDPEIVSGFRTLDEQFQLFARGRSFEKYQRDLDRQVRRCYITAEQAKVWIDFYDPAVGGNRMPSDRPMVTVTMASQHVTRRAADIGDRQLGYPSDKNHPYWEALNSAAEAEGLEGLTHLGDPAHWQLRRQDW